MNDNIIPAMTHELSRYWEQPLRDEILIDDECAMMTEGNFQKLGEYSSSIPTGAYEGKMWKAKDREGNWWLRWYGPHPEAGKVSVNQREIIVEENP